MLPGAEGSAESCVQNAKGRNWELGTGGPSAEIDAPNPPVPSSQFLLLLYPTRSNSPLSGAITPRSRWIAFDRICETRDSVSSSTFAISCSLSSSK